jgi:hypothetical protein
MERKRNIQPDAERRRADGAARRAQDALLGSPANDDRRAHLRHETAIPAKPVPVRLVDLSAHGCCLGFSDKADYRPGQFIRLGFTGGSQAISAIVRWTEGMCIGAEFTQALSIGRIEAIIGADEHPLVGLL